MGVKFKAGIIVLLVATILLSLINVYAIDNFTWYSVKSGDSLYVISKSFGTSIEDIKALNGLKTDSIYVGQALKVKLNYAAYTVKSGDTLWLISQRFGTTTNSIVQLNNLAGTSLFIGQRLMLDPSAAYIVKPGDTLWIVANKFGITISSLKEANSLSADSLNSGQVLLVPKAAAAAVPAPTPTPAPVPAPTPTTAPVPQVEPYQTQLQPVATTFYIVQAGETADSIAKKFSTTSSNIMKYNYMDADDWFNAGQRIAINGYAVRTYTVRPGESLSPARIGKLVDWFTEGQYIIKRGDVFTITDVVSGIQFKVKMMGGYNHSDIEALTTDDTAKMLKVFGGSWQWSPRAVVVFKDGMNIAASLSGMPHSFDTLPDNNMSGHCDLYLLNSKPHEANVDVNYVELHHQMVLKAAGQ